MAPNEPEPSDRGATNRETATMGISQRGFPDEEYQTRTERCQALMAERGLAALLVCTEPEVRYFTGFHTPFWQSPTRPWFTVVPASGKPIAVIPSIGAPSMGATWIDDIRTWSSPQPDDDGVSLLTDCLHDVAAAAGGGAQARIGLPMGPETHVRMPLNDLDRLRADVGRFASFTDATEVIVALRTIKSPAEIAKHRTICSIVSDAFDRMGDIVSVGMTERQAFAAFRSEILAQGADDVPYLVGATGAGGVDDIIRQPSDRLIEPGDMLIFDTGSTIDGYFSDFDRNYAFGHADQGAKDAYRQVWEATEAGLAAARPGATTSDVFTAMNAVLTAGAGGNHAGGVETNVGRMGHGLGMQVTEWPSNTATDATVIGENMVLTLEPGLSWAPGKAMVHEENIVIRPDGAELLSRRAAPDLPII